MPNTLHIITPVSRPKNLPLIFVNIRETLNNLSINWYLSYDSDIPVRCDDLKLPKEDGNLKIKEFTSSIKSKYGDTNRNVVLDYLSNSPDISSNNWIYFLDDDNFIHPNLESIILRFDSYPNVLWIMFRQVLRNGDLYLEPLFPPMLNRIDTGNNLLRFSTIGSARQETTIGKANDYIFFSRVYNNLCKKYKNPEEYVVLLDDVGAYYNYLR